MSTATFADVVKVIPNNVASNCLEIRSSTIISIVPALEINKPGSLAKVPTTDRGNYITYLFE